MNIISSVCLLILAMVFTKLYCKLAQGTRLMDKPNERSLHVIPTVRGGGIVFIGLFLLAIPVLAYCNKASLIDSLCLFFSVLLLAGVSFYDDLFNLSARMRFAVQCVSSGLTIVSISPDSLDMLLFSLHNAYLIVIFLGFFMLWAINHFNFMDGLDGFCGSQALFLFITYAFLFHQQGAFFYQDLCWIMACGLVGFLMFNLPPAKLFMGDVGSATLGFISFYMALIGQHYYQIPIGYWFILNSVFLFDSSMTLLRRIAHHEKWFAPHRKHAYQRLKQYGLRTSLILIGQWAINLFLFFGLVLIQYQVISLIWFFLCMIVVLLSTYVLTEKYYPMFLQ